MHSVMVAMMVVMVCRRNQNQSRRDLNDRLGRKDSTLLPAERTNATWVQVHNCTIFLCSLDVGNIDDQYVEVICNVME